MPPFRVHLRTYACVLPAISFRFICFYGDKIDFLRCPTVEHVIIKAKQVSTLLYEQIWIGFISENLACIYFLRTMSLFSIIVDCSFASASAAIMGGAIGSCWWHKRIAITACRGGNKSWLCALCRLAFWCCLANEELALSHFVEAGLWMCVLLYCSM